MRRLFFTLLAAALVTGCTSTGGLMGGLVPLPKILKGTLQGDTYLAPDGLFSVKSPYAKGSGEYTSMTIKELYGPKGDYVSFGPAELDQSIYRVNITGRRNERGELVPFEQAAQMAVESFSQDLKQGYGVPLIELTHGQRTVQGTPGLTWKFSQTVAPHSSLLNATSGEVFWHEVVALDAGENIVLLWVQVPKSCLEFVCRGKSDAFIESYRTLK
jgi:hypothetical protein